MKMYILEEFCILTLFAFIFPRPLSFIIKREKRFSFRKIHRTEKEKDQSSKFLQAHESKPNCGWNLIYYLSCVIESEEESKRTIERKSGNMMYYQILRFTVRRINFEIYTDSNWSRWCGDLLIFLSFQLCSILFKV